MAWKPEPWQVDETATKLAVEILRPMLENCHEISMSVTVANRMSVPVVAALISAALSAERGREPKSELAHLLERVNSLERNVAILRGNHCYSCDNRPCNFTGKTCPREGIR